MLVEEIEKAWATHEKNAPFYATPTFLGDRLMLGPEIAIARATSTQPGPNREPLSCEPRALALLAAAFCRPIAERLRGHLCRALQKQAEGDALAASIHLALMGLPRLTRQGDAARRLFAADRLLTAGVAPRTIFEVLGLSSGQLRESTQKYNYNPDQARVPAGNGWVSGQWTREEFSGGGEARRPGLSPRTRVELERPDTDSASSETQPTFPASIAGHIVLSPPAEVEQERPKTEDSSDGVQHPFQIIPLPIIEAPLGHNGTATNDRHEIGVLRAIAYYTKNGFILVSDKPVSVVVPGYKTPRDYDCVFYDPVAQKYIGVEVKTTLYDTIFFDSSQVAKDVVVVGKGGYSPALNAKIEGVGYFTYCFGCDFVNLRSKVLYQTLKGAHIPFVHSKRSGVYDQ